MTDSASSIVVLGTDFSECSRRARAVAIDCARRWGATLHVVHVTGWLHGGDDASLLRAFMEGAGVPVVTCVVFGAPARELARYARDCAAVLLVVGTYGRSGLAHVVLGSTAERLLRLAHCPVLVVPPLDAPVRVVESVPVSAQRCLVCSAPAGEAICEPCRGRIRGEAIMRQQEETRRARG